MATKKSASKKTAGTETSAEAPVKAAAKKTAEKTAPVKAAAKKTPAKGAESQASSGTEGHGVEKKSAGKGHPSHHEIQVRAYLLSEKDHHRHHQDYYWRQAEHELRSE